jgi:outer membrane lipoprotein
MSAGIPVLFGAMLALLSGCASSSFVPPSLQTQVDKTLTFEQLKAAPDSYRGRVMIVGGEVLSAKRLKEGTRLEILQIPLENQEPGLDRTKSQGRFVAVQKEFLDPATLPNGTRVTIVGEISGVMTLPLDETEYAYPMLDIKDLKVWPDRSASRYWDSPYMYPYPWGPYWGRGYGYWYGPYWW